MRGFALMVANPMRESFPEAICNDSGGSIFKLSGTPKGPGVYHRKTVKMVKLVAGATIESRMMVELVACHKY